MGRLKGSFVYNTSLQIFNQKYDRIKLQHSETAEHDIIHLRNFK